MEPQLFSCGLEYMNKNWADITKASMEPQLFSCGLLKGTIRAHFSFFSFNGAATFQLRIVYSPWFRGNHVNRASMEPQLFSCGLWKGSDTIGEIFKSLQWSRNFSVADWCDSSPTSRYWLPCFNGAATFQLRIVDNTLCRWCYRKCFNGAATFQLRIVNYNWQTTTIIL